MKAGAFFLCSTLGYAHLTQKPSSVCTWDGALNPAWQKIIFEFQDRLMVGSDTWVNSRWEDYAAIMASNRRWFAKLLRPVAEKIAYRNAERLSGRDVSIGLTGRQ